MEKNMEENKDLKFLFGDERKVELKVKKIKLYILPSFYYIAREKDGKCITPWRSIISQIGKYFKGLFKAMTWKIYFKEIFKRN